MYDIIEPSFHMEYYTEFCQERTRDYAGIQ